jgi:amino acid transporter
VGVGVFLFVGFEWVAPLAEEVRGDGLVARGMVLAVGLLTLAFTALTGAMGHVLGRTELSSAAPQLLLARRLAGPAGVWWMFAICLGASATTFNAGITSASRFLYAAAGEGLLPRPLGHLARRSRVPTAAIWTVFALAAAASLAVRATGAFSLLIDVGAATESGVYALIALSVLRIQGSEPRSSRAAAVRGATWVRRARASIFGLLALVAAADGGWAVPMALAGAAALTYWAVGRWLDRTARPLKSAPTAPEEPRGPAAPSGGPDR